MYKKEIDITEKKVNELLSEGYELKFVTPLKIYSFSKATKEVLVYHFIKEDIARNDYEKSLSDAIAEAKLNIGNPHVN